MNNNDVSIPEEVKQQEELYIQQRRKKALREGSISRPLKQTLGRKHFKNPNNKVGLALSGGGMRSATFNLGVLQALADKGFLSWFDYMATVSGGGYLGACLTSLLSRRVLATEPMVIYDKPEPETANEIDHLPEPGTSIEIVGKAWWKIKHKEQPWWVAANREELLTDNSITKTALYAWAEPTDDSVDAIFLPKGTKLKEPEEKLEGWYKIRYKSSETSTEELQTGWIGWTEDIVSEFDTSPKHFPFNPDEAQFHPKSKDQEIKPRRNHQLYHLHLNGNFIIPRLSLFKPELLSGLGSLLVGLSHTLTIFVVIFFMIAAAHYVLAGILAPSISQEKISFVASPSITHTTELLSPVEIIEVDGQKVTLEISAEASTPSTAPAANIPEPPREKPADQFWQVIFEPDPKLPWFLNPYLVFFLVGLLFPVIMFWKIDAAYENLMKEPLSADSLSTREKGVSLILQIYVFAAVLLVMALVMTYRIFISDSVTGSIYWLWMPAVFMIGSLITSVFLYTLYAQHRDWNETLRSTISAWQGVNTYGVMATLLFAIFALPYYLTVPWGINLFGGGQEPKNLTLWLFLSIGSLVLSYLVNNLMGKAGGQNWLGKIATLSWEFLKTVMNVLLVILIVSLVLLFGTLFDLIPKTDGPIIGTITYSAATLLGLAFLVLLIYLLIRMRATKVLEHKSGWIKWEAWIFQAFVVFLILGFGALIIWLFLGGLYAPVKESNINMVWWIELLGMLVGAGVGYWYLYRIKRTLKNHWWLWGISLLIAFLLVSTFYHLLLTFWSPPLSDDMSWVIVLALNLTLAIIFVLIAWFSNLNRISLHYFYRDRLAATFLRTNIYNNRAGQVIPVRDDEGLQLQSINPDGNFAPYHLIVTALNLAGSKSLTYKDSKSEPFIFSRYYCGSNNTGYIPTHLYRGGLTKLARAMTISGAALSSTLGQETFFAQAFLMTMLNLRLGYWTDNPKNYEPDKMCDKIGKPKFGRLRRDTPLTEESEAFWAKYLWQELSGAADSHDPLISLSDGGLTENLGLYPLLQRRCRLILVSDVGADPNYTFGDMARLIRRIYIEENIKIDINLDPLCPGDNGYSPYHYTIGEITYPDETKGWLIFIKPTITGDEEGSIKAYWRTHQKDHFPHQTTADQFYNEDQFESYRRLGEHTIKNVIDTLNNYYERTNEGYTLKILTKGEDLIRKLKMFKEDEWFRDGCSYTETLRLYQGFKGIKQELHWHNDFGDNTWGYDYGSDWGDWSVPAASPEESQNKGGSTGGGSDQGDNQSEKRIKNLKNDLLEEVREFFDLFVREIHMREILGASVPGKTLIDTDLPKTVTLDQVMGDFKKAISAYKDIKDQTQETTVSGEK